MTFTREELDRIEEYAGLFLSYDEIAVLLEKDAEEFCAAVKTKNDKAYLAYFRGKTKSKIEIRKNVIKMARHGSPQAELMANQYMSDQLISETE
jgi:hypothetical protein